MRGIKGQYDSKRHTYNIGTDQNIHKTTKRGAMRQTYNETHKETDICNNNPKHHDIHTYAAETWVGTN